MSVLEALVAARKVGVRLCLEDGKLIAEAPQVPPDAVAQLKAVRSDLSHVLRRREAAQAALASRRPVGAREAEWAEALSGLRRFLDDGWADQAMLLGWTAAELYRVPSVWARVDLCGSALLIGRWQVLDVDAEAITIETPQGSRLRFRRFGR
jgi:hypothetical protein